MAAIPMPHWHLPRIGRRGRLAAIALALLALFAAFGFLAVPRIAKSQIESFAATQLGREATVERIEFNPFTLRARLHDFTLKDRDPARTLLAFDTLEIDLAGASVWRRAPIFDAVRLYRPRVEIARNAAGEYSIQDLVDRALAPSPEPGKEAVFAINNIEIENGAFTLDDAVHARRIELKQLGIGIPFVSSFPRDAQVRVTPRLQGVLDNAPFALTGTTTSPFEDMQRATLDIHVDAFPVPRYMTYAPLPGALQVKDGALTTRLTLAFLTYKGTPRGISLSGTVRLDRPALARADGAPVFAGQSIDVALARLDLIGREVRLDRVSVNAPELDLRRLADGSLEATRWAPAAAKAEPAPPAKAQAAPEKPWQWSVADARIAGGKLRFHDAAVSPAYQASLADLAVTGTNLASSGAPGTVEASFTADEGATFEARAQVDFAGASATGRFDLAQLPLARLRPYHAATLDVDVRRGRLDAGADFDAAAGATTKLSLANGTAALSGLEVALRGDKAPLARIAQAQVQGVALDLATRTVRIGSFASSQGALRVLREEGGRLQFERAIPATPAPRTAMPPAAAAGEGDWVVTVDRVLLERYGVDFEDRATEPDVKLRVADARIVAENVDSRAGAKMNLEGTARVGARGRVRVDGVLATRPTALDARIDAAALDVVPVRPYFEPRTNITFTSGLVSAKGRVTYSDAGPAAKARYVGDLSLTDFGSLDRPTAQELLRWKSLAVTGMDLATEPFKVSIASVALDQFYARLILNADATLNVRQALAAPAEASAEAAATPAPAAAAAERTEIPASIGRIQLSNGEVEYSDFFVKPNYSAHLKEVNGSVTGLAAMQAGDIAVAARIDGSAPVDIRGTVNPFARELALDLTGKATDVELPPLTPYSVKYAGYGIQKGKLSMEVRYKLDNRKLEASNKLVLDQLTFGERVESPTATKLPVLLALALLKDRNGVVNLDLPIRGTLDDPQFSIWRVVVQIIVNLLTKAVTAPFALLGAIAGGGGEQLAYVEFAPGSAELTPAAQAKLATLAKALADRPGLKLDASGRAVTEADQPALKRAAYERALKLRKQRELGGEAASAPVESIRLDPADEAKYLKGLYRDTDLPGKPRNFIGLQKDIPEEEMRRMLLAHFPVDEAMLRDLATHRAQAVKEWFTTQGNLPAERVFLLAPKLGAEGLKEGAPTRVDFAIR